VKIGPTSIGAGRD